MNIWDLQANSLGVILYATDGPTEGSTHRVSLEPGSDLTGQPQEVVNLAAATWTPAVIAAYKETLLPGV